VQIDNQGYANVADMLAWRKLKSLKVTFAEVLTAVDTSDKKRFALLYNPITREKEEAETEAVESKDPFAATFHALEIAKSSQDVNPSHYLIRATQGHSLKTVEAAQLLKQIVLQDDPKASQNDADATVTTNIPETVVHGTFHGAWPHILDAGGLKPMSRNHIHFATGPALKDIMPDSPDG
ncbi:pyruvate dehydrogenase complex dihydrolipoamide acetyltransferase component (E2), partial [Ascosphaera pollenicola]